MKIIFVFALLIAAATAQFRGYTHGHNGQSACKSDKEPAGSVWRNNFDPTKYWVCDVHGQAAVSYSCQSEFLFQPTKNECVHYLDWEWTPFEDPYSLAQ